MSSDTKLPNLSSLEVEYQQIINDQTIDEEGPGTVLRDIEILLRFIGPKGITVSSSLHNHHARAR